MERIIIKAPDSISAIMVGARWEAVTRLLPGKNVVIITDENVFRLYGKNFPKFPVIRIVPGEESKKLKVIESLAGKLLKMGIDRSGFILAIGGGVVCDISGFLASVYMRGIRCGYVSTTLLSQVDASTGGKNGVNLGMIKNVIGNFRQPEFVICDTTMLRTLPDDEYMSGMAELIKTGIIGDPSIIEMLEENYARVILRDRRLLSDLVARSVKFKASVVAKDEKESGLRRILNFGHTFGHAIELQESFKHGFAVASGMELATLFSYDKGLIDKKVCNRVISLLKKYGQLSSYNIPSGIIEEFILHDKKKSGEYIHFVFIEGIGVPCVKKILLEEVVDFYKKFKKGK
ncbi:MAG TPA: 3-dehydroquinate synthase [Bacteroidales bacterium]|nr:3-dehydroquinate synthase [Bacteroidales bacterium]